MEIDIYDFVKDFADFIKLNLEKYQLTERQLFYTHNENNKKFTQEMLDYLAKKFHTTYFLEKTIVSKEDIEDECLGLPLDISSIIYNFAYNFVLENGFFILKNDEPILKTDSFKIKNITAREVSFMHRKNMYDNFPSLILENGDIYCSMSNHNSLICWLNANGYYINNALRIDHFRRDKEMSISSLHAYMDLGDKPLKLSSEQADTLFKVYDALSSTCKIAPIEKSLAMSYQLGIREIDNIGIENLETLKKSFGYLDTNQIKNIINGEKGYDMW